MITIKVYGSLKNLLVKTSFSYSRNHSNFWQIKRSGDGSRDCVRVLILVSWSIIQWHDTCPFSEIHNNSWGQQTFHGKFFIDTNCPYSCILNILFSDKFNEYFYYFSQKKKKKNNVLDRVKKNHEESKLFSTANSFYWNFFDKKQPRAIIFSMKKLINLVLEFCIIFIKNFFYFFED